MRQRDVAMWLGALVLTLVPAVAGWLVAAEDAPKPPTVKLVIDYGDGVEKHFTALPWKEGMTVLDVLEAAAHHPRGIKLVHRSSGETAFLTQIDDLKNEGRGRNWLYSVNGQQGKKSFGAAAVKAADTILWSFGEYR
jgi:hypothetical protein